MAKYKVGDRVIIGDEARGWASNYRGEPAIITEVEDNATHFPYRARSARDVSNPKSNFILEDCEIEGLAPVAELWQRVAYKEAKSHFNAEGDQCIYLPMGGGNYVTVAVMGQADFGGADAKQVERLAAKIQDFLNREVGQDL